MLSKCGMTPLNKIKLRDFKSSHSSSPLGFFCIYACITFQTQHLLPVFLTGVKLRYVRCTASQRGRKTLHNDKQATLNQSSWPHPSQGCTEINNCSVAYEHVKHLIKNPASGTQTCPCPCCLTSISCISSVEWLAFIFISASHNRN